MVNVERFLSLKYVSLCVKISKRENLNGCMIRYAAGNVLRKYGLGVIDRTKPVCFNAPWFYIRIERCIRRNCLESVTDKEWMEKKKVNEILSMREEMIEIGGLTVKESKTAWENVCKKEVINRQKDLAWMCVQGCVPTRVFQRRRRLVNSEQCPREGCDKVETIVHLLWECEYAKGVWRRMGKLIKGITGIEFLTYNMMMFGLGVCNKEMANVLWYIMCCVKEALWDTRNVCVFKNQMIDVENCAAMIRSKLFLYVLSDRKHLGNEAEGIWK
ncbi:hypothetical protein XELAEV_180196641mg, partial [Xenopus laevis]